MTTLLKTMRVLVVDDERTVCAGVEKILVRGGHEVEKALSVAEALNLLVANPAYDIILADLMMPVAGGLDLVNAVRDRWPHVPVLIMTGYASISSAIEVTRAGAIGYLPKPFTPEELEDALDHAARRRPGPAPVVAKAPPRARRQDIIDVDMPFDRAEVAAATSQAYVDHLTRSDVPMLDFCDHGQRACTRYASKGVCTQPECPLVVSERRKKAVVAAPRVADLIDVDMPFSFAEVAGATSEAYADALGRGDLAVTGRWNPARATGRRVLVVDDEPVVANSARRTLSRRGYVVEEAFSGHEALNRILREMYDLVLLDMRMPDANGLDLLPTIKKHRPGLPVVMVTGYASIDTAVEAIQRGAADYVAKPFTPDELYAATSKALRGAVGAS